VEVELCPPGGCWWWRIEPPEEIFTNPATLLTRPAPPACDARCSRIDCCGGPLPPQATAGTYVIWADGAQVRRADGVRVLRAGARQAVPLKAGERLNHGDLLQVPPAAVFEAQKDDLKFATSRTKKPDRARILLVSGPQALKQAEAPRTKAVSKQELDWHKKFGRLRFPGGEAPQEIKPAARGPGRAEAEFEQAIRKQLGDKLKPLAPPRR
jgi:hypothetical protein